jgi:hypothetical protein
MMMMMKTTRMSRMALVMALIVSSMSMLPIVHSQAPAVPAPAPPTAQAIPAAGFCTAKAGQELLKGVQVRDKETCSEMIQGSIPTVDKMVSTVILSPKNGEVVGLNTKVTFKVKTKNMELGAFADPKSAYFAAPQQLNAQGQIIGHQHIVAQFIAKADEPLDASVFEFFKGLELKDTDGILTASNDIGFNKTGEYRICTITGASTHQPVLMPVAQRGSQDDCIRITVSDKPSDITGKSADIATKTATDAESLAESALARDSIKAERAKLDADRKKFEEEKAAFEKEKKDRSLEASTEKAEAAAKKAEAAVTKAEEAAKKATAAADGKNNSTKLSAAQANSTDPNETAAASSVDKKQLQSKFDDLKKKTDVAQKKAEALKTAINGGSKSEGKDEVAAAISVDATKVAKDSKTNSTSKAHTSKTANIKIESKDKEGKSDEKAADTAGKDYEEVPTDAAQTAPAPVAANSTIAAANATHAPANVTHAPANVTHLGAATVTNLDAKNSTKGQTEEDGELAAATAVTENALKEDSQKDAAKKCRLRP